MLTSTDTTSRKSSIKRIGLILLSFLSVFSESGGLDFGRLTPELVLSQPSAEVLLLNLKYIGDPLPVQQSA